MNSSSFTLKLAASVLAGLILSSMAWGEVAQKADPRYVTEGDTVYDKKSRLTWARCSVGQHLEEGTGCEGKAETFTSDDARKLRNGGWRVPTKNELATLFNPVRAGNTQKLATGEEEFPDMNLGKLEYWTSSPSSAGKDWGIYFADGQIFNGRRFVTHAVRLVRGKRKY